MKCRDDFYRYCVAICGLYGVALSCHHFGKTNNRHLGIGGVVCYELIDQSAIQIKSIISTNKCDAWLPIFDIALDFSIKRLCRNIGEIGDNTEMGNLAGAIMLGHQWRYICPQIADPIDTAMTTVWWEEAIGIVLGDSESIVADVYGCERDGASRGSKHRADPQDATSGTDIDDMV